MSSNSTQPSAEPTPSPIPYKTLAVLVAIAAISLAFLTPLRVSLPKFFSTPVAKPIQRTMATVSSATNGTSSNLKITKRPSNARGHADHGWLYTFHTFSFASYHDRAFESFGPLRVINEDRVERGTGFGKHSHSEFLIWSYIVQGELEHKDSLGHLENLRRGEVQFTSTGTGIAHSEYNRNENEDCHFLQMYVKAPQLQYDMYANIPICTAGPNQTSEDSLPPTKPANTPTK